MSHHQAGGDAVPAPFTIRPGLLLYRAFLDRAAQADVLAAVRAGLAAAPPFRPAMPRSGKPFFGADEQLRSPRLGVGPAGLSLPAAPSGDGTALAADSEPVLAIWRQVADWPGEPEACLVNLYGPEAKMGLHQDRDEQEFAAPVVSISLGDDALFRAGGSSAAGRRLACGSTPRTSW